MAMKYLGETLDLHCGGIDLVFPHHEDEIAQSEAATGVTFSRVWCHGEFLLTGGTKMAKRVGNVSTVRDLREQGVSAAALRHFVYSTHYRKQLNLTGEALEASMEAVKRIGAFARRLDEATGGTPDLATAAEELERSAREALADDLNAPEALAALFTFIQRANAELDRRGKDAAALERARSAFSLVNGVLDVRPRTIVVTSDSMAVLPGSAHASDEPVDEAALDAPTTDLANWARARLADRREARQRRDFAAADAIRGELEEKGFVVKDTPAGAVAERYD
jgi:cysteinyl-tRNA synthetase